MSGWDQGHVMARFELWEGKGMMMNVLAIELTPLRSRLLTTSPDRLSCLSQSEWVCGAENISLRKTLGLPPSEVH